MIQVVIALLVTHLFHPVFHRRATGAGSQVQLYLVQADGFRSHDFVVFAVLQYAVLVDAGGGAKAPVPTMALLAGIGILQIWLTVWLVRQIS